MAYATVEQLTDRLGHNVPPNAQTLLDRASRDVDRFLLSAVYDATSATAIAALQEATLEQVAWRLENGDVNGIRHDAQPGVPSGVGGAGASLTRYGAAAGSASTGTPLLGDQAFAALQTAGLTGHSPNTAQWWWWP